MTINDQAGDFFYIFMLIKPIINCGLILFTVLHLDWHWFDETERYKNYEQIAFNLNWKSFSIYSSIMVQ